MSRPRRLLGAQAAYYAATGVWPLVHYESFERVTGRKRERWLVESVGGLVGAVGASLGLAARDGSVGRDTVALSAGTAATLGAIDVLYFARGRLRAVYLADALAQAALLIGWLRQRDP